MKTTILYLAFFTGMVFGTMMMAFGNRFGDYITVASVFLGLYLQITEELREKKLNAPKGGKQEPHR